MRSCKVLLLSTLLFGAGFNVQAQFDDSEERLESAGALVINKTENRIRDANIMATEIKPILKGNYSAGGNLAMGYSSYSGLIVEASPSIHYFTQDYLAFGAEILLNTSNGYNAIGVGPSIQYYFWESGPWTSYVSQSILYTSVSGSRANDTDIFSGHSRLGLNYFINDHVALGGQFVFNYSLERRSLQGSYSHLQGMFTVYF